MTQQHEPQLRARGTSGTNTSMNQSKSEQVDGPEEFALILEEQKQQFREVTDEIQRAMLNDDTELTDEMVGELKEIAERSSGLVEKIEAK